MTNDQTIIALFKSRTEVQRRLRPILDQYETACQALEDEIARIEGRTPRRIEATVLVNSGLDSDPNRAR